ncbi:MAG: hypothetical protein ACRDTA_28530 [Pseudonocardiaceae bacterium]
MTGSLSARARTGRAAPTGTFPRKVVAGDNVNLSATAPIGGDNDFLSTGGGDEAQILAGPGNDYVDAGAGNDGIDGGAGNDFCNGGAGTDTAAACEAVISVP